MQLHRSRDVFIVIFINLVPLWSQFIQWILAVVCDGIAWMVNAMYDSQWQLALYASCGVILIEIEVIDFFTVWCSVVCAVLGSQWSETIVPHDMAGCLCERKRWFPNAIGKWSWIIERNGLDLLIFPYAARVPPRFSSRQCDVMAFVCLPVWMCQCVSVCMWVVAGASIRVIIGCIGW